MRQFIIFALCWLALAACVTNPTPPQPSASDLVLPGFDDLVPDSTGVTTPAVPGIEPSAPPINPQEPLLRSQLASLGVELTNQEWAQLRSLIAVKPNGFWSQSVSRTAEQNLISNYERFGSLFNDPPLDDAETYRAQALAFAEREDVPFYLDFRYYVSNQRLLVVKWDQDSGEFVVLQMDGSLVNYLITRDIVAPRYLKVVL